MSHLNTSRHRAPIVAAAICLAVGGACEDRARRESPSSTQTTADHVPRPSPELADDRVAAPSRRHEPAPGVDNHAAFVPVQVAGARGVIVGSQVRVAFLASDGRWTPTSRDVERFERGFERYLAGPGEQEAKLRAVVTNHVRQYIGVVEAEKRYLYTQLLCEELAGPTWRSRVIRVMDGGTCFASVRMDVERGSFDGLRVNGEA